MLNIFEDSDKPRKKKALNKLLDKYGESREAISQYASVEDWFEYQFAQPDEYLDEVLEERRRKRSESSFPQTPYPSAARGNSEYVAPHNLPETEEENALAKDKWKQEKREILLERARNTIDKFEGIKRHIYLDSKGNKTVAKGKNIDDKYSFMQMETEINGRPATLKEKEDTFNLYEQLKRKRHYGSNHTADDYENVSPLRISSSTADKMMNEHLENDIKSLQKTFPEFDDFPLPLQEVLTDIHYNTGNISSSNWPNLHRGIKSKNLSLIANNVHRKDVQKNRNDWALEKIKSITSW